MGALRIKTSVGSEEMLGGSYSWVTSLSPQEKVSLTSLMEREGFFGFHFFLQRYRPPQSKIDKVKSVKEINRGGRAAKKVQSLEWRVTFFALFFQCFPSSFS